MKEIWKDIDGYNGVYQISNLGRIKSFYSGEGKIRKQCIQTRGYPSIGLKKNGVNKTHTVHQLVAITFLKHDPNGMDLVVDHINHNKLDNRVENLRLITQRQNTSKSHIKGTSKYIGVSWHKRAKKWQSQIIINNEKTYLGLFTSEKDAHNTYLNELKKLNEICSY